MNQMYLYNVKMIKVKQILYLVYETVTDDLQV